MKTNDIVLARTQTLSKLVERLLLEQAGMHIDQLILASDEIVLLAISIQPNGACPLCGHQSKRVHSRYQRTLHDLPWSGFHVHLCLRVHRFVCLNRLCAHRIFTE
jgi:transposase